MSVAQHSSPVDIPHHGQETDFTCGPAALKMVLDGLWGIRIEEQSLAEQLGTDAHTGTRQKVLAKFVEDLGLESVVHHSTTEVAEIARLMRSGHVVIVCYWLESENTDHYAVVSSMNNHEIVLQDPWTGPETAMSLDDFDAAWRGDENVPLRRHRWLLAVRVPTRAVETGTHAVSFALVDLGATLDLDAITTMLGRTPHRVDLVQGAPGGRFGPFAAPLAIFFQDEGHDVEARLYSVGVLALRITRDLDDLAGDVEARTLAWRDRLRAEVANAVRETYIVPVVVEQWDVRVVHGPVSDLGGARAFVFGDLDVEAEVQRRDTEAILVGRDRAVVWCAEGGGQDLLDVLELARAELLEFRTYDAYLDRRLEGSFRSLDRLWAAGGLFRSARAALRELAQVRVEVARLTDPLHGTGKAFGDRFTERLHARLHERMRIGAWEHAVAHKTEVLEDMFHLAQEETNHRRGLLLEVMIVVLFILDLVLLFRVG